MIRAILILLFICIGLSINGQIAIIKDADGFTNIRREPKIGDNISGQFQDGDFVILMEEKDNWTQVNGLEANGWGWVHNSRLYELSNFEIIDAIKETDDQVVFQNDKFTIELSTTIFDTTKHVLDFEIQDTGYKFCRSIDGESYYGTDGGIPRYEYSEISIETKEYELTLDRAEFAKYYDPNLKYTNVYYDKLEDRLYIRASNSDGAGAYIVLWVLQDGRVVKNVSGTPF